MKNDDVSTAGCFGSIFGFITLFLVGAFLKAWAIATLWAWFIVPAFGVQQLTYKTAIGLSLIAGIVHTVESPSNSENKTTGEIWGAAFAKAILGPLIVLLLGRIYLWMF